MIPLPSIDTMIRVAAVLAAFFIMGCHEAVTDRVATQPDSGATRVRTVQKDTTHALRPAANEGFRNVTVRKQSDSTFLVAGEARVFEAAFSWVVEDGHNEIRTGHETANGGAPAWGAFSFPVTVSKDRANSTLHLLLFENSARDGSRRNILSLPLP
jgi:hypothetical protein